jgi:hypothetical protein
MENSQWKLKLELQLFQELRDSKRFVRQDESLTYTRHCLAKKKTAGVFHSGR